MPKMKTNRAAAKRFRVTSKGKIKRKKAFLNHILSHKTKKRKRNLRIGAYVAASDEREVRNLLPYGR